MTSQPSFQTAIVLRRPGVAMFADISKIITRFIKINFRDSRKAKKLKFCTKMKSISVFPEITKLANFL